MLAAIVKITPRTVRIFLLRLFSALLLTAAEPAKADDPHLAPPPIMQMIDNNGINLSSMDFYFQGPSVSIGPAGQGGLSYSPHNEGAGLWFSTPMGNVKAQGDYQYFVTVTLMGKPYSFILTGSDYDDVYEDGASLTYDSGSHTYTLLIADGTVATFVEPGTPFLCDIHSDVYCTFALISTMTLPSGEIQTFTWKTESDSYEILSIQNNLGYQIKFNYASSGAFWPSSVIALNNAYDWCDPTAIGCSGLTYSWPTMTYSGDATTMTITDPDGNATTGTYFSSSGGPGILHNTWRIIWPSGQGTTLGRHKDYSWDTCSPPNLCNIYHRTVSDGSNTWTYDFLGFDPPIGTTTVTITDPLGNVRVVASDQGTGLPQTETIDPGSSPHLDLTTTYDFDGNHRLLSVTYPEGNYTALSYDDRHNITEIRKVSKTPGTPTDIVTSATYAASCDGTNYKICNKPGSITDPMSNETDFAYDPAHGGILTETGPAVTGGQLVTNYSYSALSAWYKTSGSSTLYAGPTIYRQVGTSSPCATNANIWGTAIWGGLTWSCSNTTSSARITTSGYQSGSSSVPSNLLAVTETVAAGDGSISSTVTSAHDLNGRVVSASGPISGDDKEFFYDANNNPTGVIQPDPDGSGSLLHPATRTTYNVDSQVGEVEQGTTTGTTMGTFSPLTQTFTDYDSVTGAKVQDKLVIGGSSPANAITQYSYDGAGNPLCTALRENPSAYPPYSSLPGACTLSTTSIYGTDQISHNNYDAANRLASIQKGYGTGSPITVVANSYTANSKLQWMEDGNGNRSYYTYDGQDNLVKLQFPDKTTVHTPSATDYEQYSYDANGNMLSKTLRSGETIGYTYDALNRLTVKDIPGGTANDVYYGYDLMGNQVYAHFASAGGSGVDSSYDALGRKTSETEYGRTVSSQYDAAGNRTLLTYPDGNYIQYTYDILNRMLQVKENGSTTLAQYSYDDLSRETGISRPANSTSTSASYVSTSTSWTLTQTMSGSNVAFDLSFTPANQVSSRTITTSDSSYKYSVPSASSPGYSPNGLNQYASVGGTSFSYDARGNLTSDGSHGFSYDLENHLTGTTGPTTALSYDPLGRMQQTVASSVTEQYLYDGSSLIEEFDGSGTALRRYVPGRDPDEALVWYEGTGLSTRNWLHTDEQGSVIATSNGSGTATPQAYSATGEPAGGWSAGGPIFRYTGQAQLPAVRLYYYKARMYDPALGRFLQTDPVGYSAGPNLYAYVGNDPTNRTDPSGKIAVVDDATEALIALTAATGAVAYCEIAGCMKPLANWVDRKFNDIINRSDQEGPQAKQDPKPIFIDPEKYPEAAQHIKDAQAKGQPDVVTVDREGAAGRRRKATSATPTESGKDRDEYPPAIAREGGTGSSVRPIGSSDNRGAGGSFGSQIQDVPNGGEIQIIPTKKPDEDE